MDRVSINSVFSWLMKKRVHQIELFMKYPYDVQKELLGKLLDTAALTDFGLEHQFLSIRNVEDYKKAVPIRNYEDYVPYIEQLKEGKQGVLWPSKIKWFAVSAGTTSGRSKYIPVSKEALEDCHFKGGKDILSLYYHNHPSAKLYEGKNLVVGGSSQISPYSKHFFSGDISAIMIKNLPLWVEYKRTPSNEIALLPDWEEKIERMASATIQEDVSMIVGVPSWTLVLLNRILEITGAQNIHEIWPNLELFMHGGVSFKPYKNEFQRLLSTQSMNYYETYNSSEGSFGMQDRPGADDMLLMLDYGIFYEFMPIEEYGKEDPQTIGLEEVEIGKVYALIISTNAGLYRYMIGDTICFTSRQPYRIQVVGRTKHFINAFGEELMIGNADEAISKACEKTSSTIVDYTAAPVFANKGKKGRHEWLIEFSVEPRSLDEFTRILDENLKEINSDYDAKRSYGLSMEAPIVQALPKDTFQNWLRNINKLGGQHKVPRLCNTRKYIDQILESTLVN